MAKYNVIEKYGITFRRLTEDKIELVRRWRNDPKISQYMEYREIITPEQQLAWFRRIDNEYNYFFIIEAEGKEIGLINVRDIDYDRGVGEPGIFIWDDGYLDGIYSFKCALTMCDFCFYDLGLSKLIIHVLKDNKRAIKFNIAQGYVISKDQDCQHNQEYTLIPEDYEIKKKKIIKYIL